MRKTIEIAYLYQKRGVFYFSRRIPEDLKGHYRQPRIMLSLRTKSVKAAQAKSLSLAAQLDEEWMTLRWRRNDSPLSRFLIDRAYEAGVTSTAPLMSEAKDLYLRSKGKVRPKTFSQAVDRAVEGLINLAEDKPIDTYTRQEANLMRDAVFERGMSRATVKKTLNTIRTIVNFTSRECGLQDVNAFSGLYFGDDESQPDGKRPPVPRGYIQSVQEECLQQDDEGRWLIALISNTGMRLSEAAGLHKLDLNLNDKSPHINLKPHPWRRLKTKGSERIIPLVGASLWAAKRAAHASDTEFLFPRYCSQEGCKSNSASAVLNKWLSPRVPDGCVIHSFRHSIRDRLRAVECPQDIMDRLGGWSVGGIGESYGVGYPVDVLFKWMEKAVSG